VLIFIFVRLICGTATLQMSPTHILGIPPCPRLGGWQLELFQLLFCGGSLVGCNSTVSSVL